MAGPSHSTMIAAVYATIAAETAVAGDYTLAALHVLLAWHYWHAGRGHPH